MSELLKAYIKIDLQQRIVDKTAFELRQSQDTLKEAVDVITKMRGEINTMQEELTLAKISIPNEVNKRMKERMTMFDQAKDAAIRAMQRMVAA